MQLRPNRQVEREALNATRSLFESCGYVFQEMDLANDYGKDVYVDVTDGQTVTGLCIALQVKGGDSYKRAKGYIIPLDQGHADMWAQSSLPIAGIVYDPSDGKLHWCNISQFLATHVGPLPSNIPVDLAAVLSKNTIHSEFRASFAAYHMERYVGAALLRLTSDDQPAQIRALRECFVHARHDPRVLTMIRYMLQLFTDNALRTAVTILAHVTPHPDILWTKSNWIPESTCDLVCKHFRWSQSELELLFGSADSEEWGRGGQGQNVYSLFCKDPDIEQKMERLSLAALANGQNELASRSLYLVLGLARREGPQKYRSMVALDPRYKTLEDAADLEEILEKQGCILLH